MKPSSYKIKGILYLHTIVIIMMVHHPTPSPSGDTVVQREATKVSLQVKVIFAVEKNSEASTGFEPMTSAIVVRCSTDWSMKLKIRSQNTDRNIHSSRAKRHLCSFWHFVHHVYLVIRQKSSVSVIPPRLFIDPKQFGIHTFVFYHIFFVLYFL